MLYKLDISNGSTWLLQPQFVDDSANERKHEADQKNVGVGD
jgi:hypothetical protein